MEQTITRFVKAAEIGTGGAMTLPGAFYTSPEVFRQEQERIFLQRWLCAGRAEQIPESGDFFVRSIGNESVGTEGAGTPVTGVEVAVGGTAVGVDVGVAVGPGIVGVAVATGVAVAVGPTPPAHSATPLMTWHSKEPISQTVSCGRDTPR